MVARDGSEALRLFDETEPDVVLLDLMLPKISGLDVCRAIRARSSVPIIMVTAKGAEIDTVVALEVGADDYVTKPYRLRELVARMRAVMRRRPGGHRRGTPSELRPATRTLVEAGRGAGRHRPAAGLRARRGGRTCGARSSSSCACWWRTPAGCSPATC